MTAITPISLKSPPSHLRATANFHLAFPKKLQTKLKEKVFIAAPEDRGEVWKNLNLDTDKIENSFKDMLKERNKFAQNQGFLSRLEMAIGWFDIPKRDYKNFVENVDNMIDSCNQQLLSFEDLPRWFYSEFNIPCFICQIPKFPLKTLDCALDYLVKNYEILNKFKNKINIKSGEESKTIYRKEFDDFEVTINKSLNTRHQITDLIHELSHVVARLQSFKQKINLIDKGVYLREKETLEIEMEILRKLSPDLYKATIFGETLILFHQTLFEIEIYKNSDQNLKLLYAKVFNRCFKNAKQKANSLYLLDEQIIFNPFSSLPYAVTNINVLLKNIP